LIIAFREVQHEGVQKAVFVARRALACQRATCMLHAFDVREPNKPASFVCGPAAASIALGSRFSTSKRTACCIDLVRFQIRERAFESPPGVEITAGTWPEQDFQRIIAGSMAVPLMCASIRHVLHLLF
jgi:hypothetical protein